MGILQRIKYKLYYDLVVKNQGVRREYEPYVETHMEEHVNQRWKHWWMLIRLNWHYRVMRRDTYLIQSDQPKNAESNENSTLILNCPESQVFNRKEPHFLAKELMGFDVVSFDIFDTLILRPFLGPAEMFDLVAARLHFLGYFRSFKAIRIDAEKEARAESYSRTGTYEVNIFDIYKKIEKLTNIDANVGIETEFQVELDCCMPNPYMQRVFNILIAAGKRVIITSDMYYPADMMERLLLKCGYKGYEKIFVSCDYKCSKGKGILYDVIKRYADGGKIVHVGDNPRSDIDRARKAGIEAVYYRSVRSVGEKYRPKEMSDLITSTYDGVVLNHLHNGLKKYGLYYEFGFIYGGIYVLGFCLWLHKRVKEKGIKKLIFLSRDGFIIKQVFDRLFSDVETSYLYWSRMTAAKYYIVNTNLEDYIERFILGKLSNSTKKISIGGLLHTLGLECISAKLKDYGLTPDTLLAEESKNQTRKLFENCWDIIKDTYQDELQMLKHTLETMIQPGTAVGFVDGPSTGSSSYALKYLAQNQFKISEQCTAFLSEQSNRLLKDASIEAFLFSSNLNRQNYSAHYKKLYFNTLFELLTQACHPSFKGYGSGGPYEFDIPEVENYENVKQIHQGIMDFCSIYYSTFAKDPIALNISGHDAYMPYKSLLMTPNEIRKYGDLRLEISAFANDDVGEISTLHEVIDFIEKKKA